MSSSTKRSTSVLLSLLFLVGALAVYANFVRPEFKEVQQLRAMLAAKTQLLENQKTIIAQIQNLLDQFKGAVQLQQTVSMALPTNEDAAAIVQQINAIANANGLVVQAFGLNPLALSPTKLGSVRGTLRLIGAYDGIKKFLQSLETNVRVMDLVSLRLEQGSKANQDVYAYTVVFNAYYQQ